jgi:hypothetical protein
MSTTRTPSVPSVSDVPLVASTARQLANRANAQKSTGPATPEGKARSSQNARKHGFLSSIMPFDAKGWMTMLDGLYRSLKPANEIEQLIVDQIGIAYLRLSRLYVHEANVDMHAFVYNLVLPNLPKPGVKPTSRLRKGFVSAYDCVRDPGAAGDAEAYQAGFVSSSIPDMPAPEPKKRFFEDDRAHLRMRYETMLTRQIGRSMTLLDKLQKERKEAAANGTMEEAPFLPAYHTDGYDPDDEAEMKAAREAMKAAQERHIDERYAKEMKEKEEREERAARHASAPVCESKEDQTPTPSVPSVPLVPPVPSKTTKANTRALLARIRNERRQHALSREKRARAA